MEHRQLKCAVLMALCTLSAVHSAAESIPNDALSVIKRISTAAAKNDFAELERLMVRDFQWSFGGDSDVAQALAAWRNDPKYLRNLHRVTTLKCGFLTKEIVQCPSDAGEAFRAGFGRTPAGWRMRYFVEGD